MISGHSQIGSPAIKGGPREATATKSQIMAAKSPHMHRVSIPRLEKILGKPFPVLDKGFVRLVDYMGGDESIVQAARVSYGKGTKRLHEDRGLIRYLMRHRHTTPFEMCELKLHVRVPMDCWRQWIRHRTANVNEYSTRYSIAIDASQDTQASHWRLQAEGNRQGSRGFLAPHEGTYLSRRESEFLAIARRVYEERIERGVAREQARKDLPLSTYTEAYWKIDLHNLFNFLSLRMSSHAQNEIRQYAQCIGTKIVAKWCPASWEAFVDYRLNSINLSRLELEVLKAILESPAKARSVAIKVGFLSGRGQLLKRGRELTEFEEKLKDLGVPAPWGTHA